MTYKFLLHANQFTETGDSVDLMLMSKHLKEILQIDSVITFPKFSFVHNQRFSEAKSAGHNLYMYKSRSDLEKFVKSEKITHNYVFNNGKKSNISYLNAANDNPYLGDTKHITRAVFRNYEPFGDYYLYVSEWLFDWSKRKISLAKFKKNSTTVSWLPHMVDPQVGDGAQFRKKLGIPSDVKVIGRIGGLAEFNDKAAKIALIEYIEKNKNVYAILANTNRFFIHPRIFHVDFLNRDEIWDFYDAADLFLNGRMAGESFGFSIAEPLALGKPVIGPGLIRNPLMNKHHTYLLDELDLLYNSKNDLLNKISREMYSPTNSEKLTRTVSNFSPENVLKRFSQLVLN